MSIPFYLKNACTKAKEHAAAHPNEEVCGLIVEGKIRQGVNVVSGICRLPDGSIREKSKETDFEFDPMTFAAWGEAIAAGLRPIIYHSHVTDKRDFTAADVQSIYETGCPWLLIHTPSGTVEYFDPQAKLPYAGRKWHDSYSNCFTLVRDWLRKEMDFDLQGPILENLQTLELDSWNEVIEGCDRQLVKQPRDFSQLKRGDVLVMRLGDRSVNPNHLAVVVSPERNEILHQLPDSSSCVKSLTSGYRKSTYAIYRIPA